MAARGTNTGVMRALPARGTGLVAAMLWLVCVACLLLSRPAVASAQPADSANSADQAATATYVVCTDAPWPPFQMLDGKQLYGFDIDIMRAIAVLEGFDIQLVDMALSDIAPSLRHGQCDIGAAGLSITANRQQRVDFSRPYHISNQALLVRKDSIRGALVVLTGGGGADRIGATRGSSGAYWIQSQLVDQKYGVLRVLYDSYSDAIAALLDSKLDGVMEDLSAAQAAVATHADQLRIAGLIRTREYYGFPVPPGDPENLLPKVNNGMQQLGMTVNTAGDSPKLVVRPGSPWADLQSAYFSADEQGVKAAWKQCGKTILHATGLGDVRAYASCMLQSVSSASSPQASRQ